MSAVPDPVLSLRIFKVSKIQFSITFKATEIFSYITFVLLPMSPLLLVVCSTGKDEKRQHDSKINLVGPA